MINVLICDDSQIQMKMASEILDRHINSDLSDFELSVSTVNPDDLADMVRQNNFKYDIAILDIDMGDLNGIDIATDINILQPQCQIIFLTDYTRFISDSYEAKHMYYILKDNIETVLPKAMRKAIDNILHYKPVFLDFISARQRYSLPCDSIYYIERLNRGTNIYTADSTYTIYDSLRTVSDKLPAFFCKCHSAFTVNMNYIRTASSTNIELTDGRIIPISRANAKAFKKQYLQYVSSHKFI